MLVYRNSQRVLPAANVVRELVAKVQQGEHARDALDEALLRAGELECALADLQHPAHGLCCALTEALAACRLTGARERLPRLARALAQASWTGSLTLKTPEGFAYYALLPMQYAALAAELGPRRTAVIGVRSIGTTLSAVVTEALRARQLTAARISVRPQGHPWDRKLAWREPERAFVVEQALADADFVIVDEGPGMSGSTFLAVAEALEQLDVPAARIRFFCSHVPDASKLVAPRAAARWPRYHSVAPPALVAPPASIDVSGGLWRRHFGAEPWPACWVQLERVKWWYPERGELDKFEGLAPYGSAALARAQALADAGFAPQVRARPDGFARYTMLAGRPAHARDLTADRLAQLARYCAYRSRAFPAAASDVQALTEMLHVNLEEIFGRVPGPVPRLEVRVPVVCDARMQPHEWRFDARGELYKTDGHGHGDDHLLPGPTDVCWDLAGAISEWQLDDAAAAALLSEYVRLTGDREAARRLPAFRVAYGALRCGMLRFAEQGADASEAARLQCARRAYEEALARLLPGVGA